MLAWYQVCQDNMLHTITPPPAWTHGTRQDGPMLSCCLFIYYLFIPEARGQASKQEGETDISRAEERKLYSRWVQFMGSNTLRTQGRQGCTGKIGKTISKKELPIARGHITNWWSALLLIACRRDPSEMQHTPPQRGGEETSSTRWKNHRHYHGQWNWDSLS